MHRHETRRCLPMRLHTQGGCCMCCHPLGLQISAASPARLNLLAPGPSVCRLGLQWQAKARFPPMHACTSARDSYTGLFPIPRTAIRVCWPPPSRGRALRRAAPGAVVTNGLPNPQALPLCREAGRTLSPGPIPCPSVICAGSVSFFFKYRSSVFFIRVNMVLNLIL